MRSKRICFYSRQVRLNIANDYVAVRKSRCEFGRKIWVDFYRVRTNII